MIINQCTMLLKQYVDSRACRCPRGYTQSILLQRPSLTAPSQLADTRHASKMLDDQEMMMPDIDEDLEGYQIESGAVFADDLPGTARQPHKVPVSFGNDSKAIYSIEEDVVVVDASDWTRLRVAGPDAVPFLQGQLSVDVARMQPGSGKEACLLTPQGRVIDIVMVLRMETSFMLICSNDDGASNDLLEGPNSSVKAHLEKHIFMSDHVEVMDVSRSTAMFRVMGPKSNDILYTLKLDQDVLGGEYGTHRVVGFDKTPLIVVKGSELGYSGYTLIVDESASASMWKTLVSGFGAIPMGSEAWNISRIVSGRPSVHAELKEPVTAFEAGLYHAVSLNKGCYVGQETLSKVYNRDAVRSELWGFISEMPCSPGDIIYHNVDGELVKIGKITSAADDISKTPVEHRALGFLKRSQAIKGTTWNSESVLIGDALVPGIVRPLPYLASYPSVDVME